MSGACDTHTISTDCVPGTSQGVMAVPLAQRQQSAAGPGDQQHQAAFAASTARGPEALGFEPGGTLAHNAQPESTGHAADAALHPQHASAHPSSNGAATGGTPCSGPSQRPAAGAQPVSKQGDSSRGTADRNTAGVGSNLGGTLKPAVKYKAQKAWRDRQKVQSA